MVHQQGAAGIAMALSEPEPPKPVRDDELSGLKTRLCQAVLGFQSAMLDFHSRESGSLAQVWLPERNDDASVVLRTKGLPFCVAGVGDLLALFRCISCRYCFGTSVDAPEILGAPGRVYTTGEPEFTRNVQQYSKEVYLRTAEASQCRVHSVLVLPLFADARRRGALGVLELVTTTDDLPFDSIVATLDGILQRCRLFTCDPSVRHKEMEPSLAAAKTFAKLRVGSGLRRASHSSSDNGSPAALAAPAVVHGAKQEEPAEVKPATGDDCATAALSDPEPAAAHPSVVAAEADQPPFTAPAVRSAVYERVLAAAADTSILRRSSRASSMSAGSGGFTKRGSADGGTTGRRSMDPGTARPSMDAGEGDFGMGDEDWDYDLDDGDGSRHGDDAFRRRGKVLHVGTGNSGKPGKKLRLEDLQGQFGVGLKEAASRLGICATTLKRACRRHGIQRWPRRQLVKLSKALDEHISEQQGKGEDATGQGWIAPVPDNRWSTLAKIVPNLDDEDERDGTGRMSMSPPTTARGSLVPVFEGAIPDGCAPEPPQHGQAAAERAQPAEPAARVAAAAVPGGVGGSTHGVSWQPTVSSAIPAGSGHSGGSGPHDPAGSDVGSGTGNTPKASHEFNWALGLDLPPHEEGDPLFAGIQVPRGQDGAPAAAAGYQQQHNGSLPHPHALAGSLEAQQPQHLQQHHQGGADMQWRFPTCSGPASPVLQPPSVISFEEPHTFRVPAATLQTRGSYTGSQLQNAEQPQPHSNIPAPPFQPRGMGVEQAVIEREPGQDGVMSLTFTHQQTQAPLPPSSAPDGGAKGPLSGAGSGADLHRPALQRVSAPSTWGPFHQAQVSQQAALIQRKAQHEEALQRNHQGGSGGTLSMVEHNMAASPGFQPPSPSFRPSSTGFLSSAQHQGGFQPHPQGFRQQQQQTPSRQQLQQQTAPQHQQDPEQQPDQRRGGFDGNRLPEPPEGMQKLSTSSLDALMATGDFSLEPYMEDDIGLVDGEVFQLMLRS